MQAGGERNLHRDDTMRMQTPLAAVTVLVVGAPP
jgi:hypothetical protein